MTANMSKHRLLMAPTPQAFDRASKRRRGPQACSSQDRLTWEYMHMTDPRVEWASGLSECDTRAQSDVDSRPVRALTIDDLDRAAAAAVDLDDPSTSSTSPGASSCVHDARRGASGGLHCARDTPKLSPIVKLSKLFDPLRFRAPNFSAANVRRSVELHGVSVSGQTRGA